MRRDVRRIKPFVRVLRLPGMARLLARMARRADPQLSAALIRWFLTTGIARLERAVQSSRPLTGEELLDALAATRPPPPAGFEAILSLIIEERRRGTEQGREG